MLILNTSQIRSLDDDAISNGVSSETLMERAGRGVVDVILKNIPDISSKRVAVVIGKGKNGGDGLVAARMLSLLGASVTVVSLFSSSADKDFMVNMEKLKKSDVKIIPAGGAYGTVIEDSDIVIDSVFGTGFRGNIDKGVEAVLCDMNNCRGTVVSCDIPSGIEGDTGKIGGACVKADITVTFGYPKKGMFMYPGADYVGRIETVDIGLDRPDQCLDIEMISRSDVRRLMPRRESAVHKKDMGHVLVVAGSLGMTGACCMTSMGALRAGAGLVTAGIPKKLNDIIETKLTEVMTLPLPHPPNASLNMQALKNINRFIVSRHVDAVALGPGLSSSAETGKLVRKFISAARLPVVLDADGINAFSGRLDELAASPARIVITPHPGEFSRLTGMDTDTLRKDRIRHAMALAKKAGVICVLKGYQTIVTDGNRAFINPIGNPGMATAGSGDILTGMISGLIKQIGDVFKAAVAAVYIHALAGDLASRKTGYLSLIAGDILDHLPEAFEQVRRSP